MHTQTDTVVQADCETPRCQLFDCSFAFAIGHAAGKGNGGGDHLLVVLHFSSLLGKLCAHTKRKYYFIVLVIQKIWKKKKEEIAVHLIYSINLTLSLNLFSFLSTNLILLSDE